MLLEPRDMGELPERRVHDRQVWDLERREVEMRIDGQRAQARLGKRLGEAIAFV